MLEIVTERLVLRPLQLDDVPAFAAYRSDPDVARYQSWDTTFSPADAERLVASQQDVAIGDPGAWLQLGAVDRVSGALCGDCALRMAADQPLTAEVGVTFAPATQGSGLATEALGAVVTRLFEQHGVHRVYAQPTTATFPSTAFSNGWASGARRAWWKPTGSRVNGPRCASTRPCAANGGRRRRPRPAFVR